MRCKESPSQQPASRLGVEAVGRAGTSLGRGAGAAGPLRSRFKDRVEARAPRCAAKQPADAAPVAGPTAPPAFRRLARACRGALVAGSRFRLPVCGPRSPLGRLTSAQSPGAASAAICPAQLSHCPLALADQLSWSPEPGMRELAVG